MKIVVRSSIEVPAAPHEVFDFVVDPESPPLVFKGAGPVPGVSRVELLDGEPRVGGRYVVYNDDGSAVTREITAMDRPDRHAYALVDGFKFPFSLLIRSAEGEWRFERRDVRTLVTWTFTFALSTILVWGLAYPLLRLVFRRAMEDCLRRTHDLLTQRARLGTHGKATA